jgi:hypothetical protein
MRGTRLALSLSIVWSLYTPRAEERLAKRRQTLQVEMVGWKVGRRGLKEAGILCSRRYHGDGIKGGVRSSKVG